ncbi:MAG TPA: DUF2249 domain-containing protein [Usitatibacter sp.]|nr:DUF2249 domain-containing protein [Usitatibacter sp.]
MNIVAVDLRELPAPEPLLRILEATGEGAGPHVFLLPFEPRPLYPLLESRGWDVKSRALDDAIEVTVSRKR